MWQAIADLFEWQCPNIAGYVLDNVEDPECKGFNLKTLNGITSIEAIGIERNRRREKFCDLELSGEMTERWNHTKIG